jgi:hypothetical protein
MNAHSDVAGRPASAKRPWTAVERAGFVSTVAIVVDTHPLASADPNGVDIFYLVLGGGSISTERL